MSLRALLLGTTAAAFLAGTAAAQTGSVTTGGSATGGLSAGGTGSGTGTITGSAPTQLLPQGGGGSGDLPRSLSGLPQQGGAQTALDAAESAEFGTVTGPIATTPTPMNAPSAFSDTGGTRLFTPTPRNAPVLGSTTVPPLFGTGVPPLSGDTGLGFPAQGLETGTGAQAGLARGGFVRFNGQILSVREATQLQRQLQAQQNQAGAQVIILSGSVFQGTTDRPNVVVAPTGQGTAGQARGLTAQTLQQGQPVLQGTVEAPRVIALAPAPGNVLVVQGSQFADTAATGTGQIRAQIVELPAE
jgi:hypothetical protein